MSRFGNTLCDFVWLSRLRGCIVDDIFFFACCITM